MLSLNNKNNRRRNERHNPTVTTSDTPIIKSASSSTGRLLSTSAQSGTHTQCIEPQLAQNSPGTCTGNAYIVSLCAGWNSESCCRKHLFLERKQQLQNNKQTNPNNTETLGSGGTCLLACVLKSEEGTKCHLAIDFCCPTDGGRFTLVSFSNTPVASI